MLFLKDFVHFKTGHRQVNKTPVIRCAIVTGEKKKTLHEREDGSYYHLNLQTVQQITDRLFVKHFLFCSGVLKHHLWLAVVCAKTHKSRIAW